jgi:hypothetical protein
MCSSLYYILTIFSSLYCILLCAQVCAILYYILKFALYFIIFSSLYYILIFSSLYYILIFSSLYYIILYSQACTISYTHYILKFVHIVLYSQVIERCVCAWRGERGGNVSPPSGGWCTDRWSRRWEPCVAHRPAGSQWLAESCIATYWCEARRKAAFKQHSSVLLVWGPYGALQRRLLVKWCAASWG